MVGSSSKAEKATNQPTVGKNAQKRPSKKSVTASAAKKTKAGKKK